uniref:Uncharacterized protein n=1 Tax=Anguilla anguilla TaxID=7936 RepID=A0A0E9R628_ANGAN
MYYPFSADYVQYRLCSTLIPHLEFEPEPIELLAKFFVLLHNTSPLCCTITIVLLHRLASKSLPCGSALGSLQVQ